VINIQHILAALPTWKAIKVQRQANMRDHITVFFLTK
jgi:hypothetical protein